MIVNQMALIRRELWEHRSIYVTPLVIGLIIVMMSVTGHVAISTMDQAVDLALLGATNVGENERAVAINVMLISVSTVMVLALIVPTNELNDEFVNYFDEKVAFRTDTDFIMDNLTGIYQIEHSLPAGGTGS